MPGNVSYDQYNTGNTYDCYSPSLFSFNSLLEGDTEELLLTASLKVALVFVL